MRIKDKKMFVRGILLLLLGVGIAISRFCIFTDATHGMLRPDHIHRNLPPCRSLSHGHGATY